MALTIKKLMACFYFNILIIELFVTYVTIYNYVTIYVA